jgi:hypothetical protein
MARPLRSVMVRVWRPGGPRPQVLTRVNLYSSGPSRRSQSYVSEKAHRETILVARMLFVLFLTFPRDEAPKVLPERRVPSAPARPHRRIPSDGRVRGGAPPSKSGLATVPNGGFSGFWSGQTLRLAKVFAEAETWHCASCAPLPVSEFRGNRARRPQPGASFEGSRR